jgi:hypothetical protein
MMQTVIVAIPAFLALFICVRRGPEQAMLDVYLPALLLLPELSWPISGQLTFASTAILPIAAFLLMRPRQRWEWSSADFLVITLLSIRALAEGMDQGYKLGQNQAIQDFTSIFLPYFAVKEMLGDREFASTFVKRIVALLAFVAIVSVYESRMGSNLFTRLFAGIFPSTGNTQVFRFGFKRVEGPYGHAILAGVMMAIGYRLARWLEWTGQWTERFWILPISKVRFCELCILLGSILTISVGPWLGAVGGAVVIAAFRAVNRKRAMTLLILAFSVLFLPTYSAVHDFVSVDPMQAMNAGNAFQEDSAYRGKLVPLYLPVVEERPTWGWGRNGIPVLEGMASIDNAYLQVALTFGVYALGLLLAILVWTPIRLIVFGAKFPHDSHEDLSAYTLLAIYILIAISSATVWLGLQTEIFFFLLTAWSDRLVLGQSSDVTSVDSAVEMPLHFAFRRVMT